MKHISIVLYENVMCTAVSNTIALLTSANDLALRKHLPALFQIEFIGTEKKRNHDQSSDTISMFKNNIRGI